MTVKEYNRSVDNFSDAVYRFILKNVKDEAAAKDIVQDCYEKLWVRLKTIDFQKVKSYIFTTAYHTMIDYVRKESRLQELEEGHDSKLYCNSSFSDVNDLLDKGLERLPEVQKRLILLRDYEGYSYEEIAEITNLSASQVKVYIFRARKSLKQYIGTIESIL